MNNVNFKRGEILLGENNDPRKGNHYIIFFDNLDGIDFIGAMISTKSYKGINIPMKSEHFEPKWRITYNASFLVPAKLYKFNEMGPFSKVGQLTKNGIDFITNTISELPLLPWDEYLKSIML